MINELTFSPTAKHPRALAYAIAQAITGDQMKQTIKIALGAASFHLWLSVSRYIL
jgi:hypothetical protein